MKFCPECGLTMLKDMQTGNIMYKCLCGTEVVGTAYDRRIVGSVLGSSETAELFKTLIASAAFDRTNQLVKRDCSSCGRDYMTQIRVGESELIFYKCKCGI